MKTIRQQVIETIENFDRETLRDMAIREHTSNGWINDCAASYGVCHNDTDKVIMDGDGKAVVTSCEPEPEDPKEKPIYVSFHIGRGGRFHNPGHLTFRGEEDFQFLLIECSDSCIIISEDVDGNTLSDEDWTLEDLGGNVILQGRSEIDAKTGRLEWDGEYNTDYTTTADDLSDEEIEAIKKSGAYISDELSELINNINV